MIMLMMENEQDKIEVTQELEKLFHDVCCRVMESEDCRFDAEISITLVENERIREINSEQRGIDRVTDVLSFPMLEFDENGEAYADFDSDGDFVLLGDIVISPERAVQQAEEYGHSYMREMAFLTAHSMLHLLGYDHVDSAEDEKIMCEKQEAVLQSLGITRDI